MAYQNSIPIIGLIIIIIIIIISSSSSSSSSSSNRSSSNSTSHAMTNFSSSFPIKFDLIGTCIAVNVLMKSIFTHWTERMGYIALITTYSVNFKFMKCCRKNYSHANKIQLMAHSLTGVIYILLKRRQFVGIFLDTTTFFILLHVTSYDGKPL